MAIPSGSTGTTYADHRHLHVGEKRGPVKFGPRAILFNGQPFVHGMGGRGELIDGVQVESIEFDPLPAPEGELQLLVEEIGDVRGRWHVSFPVTRAPLSELTRTVAIAEAIDLTGGILTVEDMLIAPTQTVLRLHYRGEGPAPDLIGSGEVAFFLDGEQLEPRGGSGSGSLLEDGSWEQSYELERSPTFTPGTPVTIRWQALPGGKLAAPGGRCRLYPRGQEVRIRTSLRREGGYHNLYAYKDNTWLFEAHRWEVIDDVETHPVNRA